MCEYNPAAGIYGIEVIPFIYQEISNICLVRLNIFLTFLKTRTCAAMLSLLVVLLLILTFLSSSEGNKWRMDK